MQYESDTRKRFDPGSNYSMLYTVTPAGVRQFVTLHSEELEEYKDLRDYSVKQSHPRNAGNL